MSIPRISAGNSASIVGAVFAGSVSALLFAYALAHAENIVVFLTIYLTSLPLFLIGLAGGGLAGLVASLTGAFGLFATLPSNIGVLYTFIFAVPATLLIGLALRFRIGVDQKKYWYPEGFLMTAITLYPCAIFLLFVALTSSHSGGLLDITQQAYDSTGGAITNDFPAFLAPLLPYLMPIAVKFTPAILGCAWILVIALSMIAAQTLLKTKNWNVRTSFGLLDLHMPQWIVFALAATGVAGFIAPAPWNYVSENLAIILGLPLFLVGLAVVHVFASRLQHPTLALVVFYVLLSIVFWLAPLVALLSVFDQWFHFRERWQRNPNPSV